MSCYLREDSCYLEDKDAELPNAIPNEESLILESDDKFILIGKTKDEKKWFGLFPVLDESWFNACKDHEHSFHATVLDNVVYILTKNLEFIQFNSATKFFNKSEPFKGKKLDFNDLILTSHQAGDEKVVLVNKSSGKIHIFFITQKKWIKKYQIMKVNICSENSSVNAGGIIAFTSTFLSLKNINPLYNQKFS